MKRIILAIALMLSLAATAQARRHLRGCSACRGGSCPAAAAPATASATVGDPDDHFRGGPGPHGDFHGGGWGGYGGGYGWHGGPYVQPVNPWNFVAPIITNFATAPRMVVNPLTGQSQMMSPGRWQVVNAGTPAQAYIWQSLPIWPIVGNGAKPSACGPVQTVQTQTVRGILPFRPFQNFRPFRRFRDDSRPRPTPIPIPVIPPAPVNPPAPVVPPKPPTPPTPGQTVGNGSLYCVCVVDSLTSQSAELAAVERDAAIQAALAAHGNHFAWIDPSTAPPELAAALGAAKAAGLPRAVFLDSSKPAGQRVVGSAPLTTAADLLAAIQTYEGK